MIADEAMMWQELEYIHNNPVRRGYVDDPVHWRCVEREELCEAAGA